MRWGWVILTFGLMVQGVGAQTAFDADWDGSGRVDFGDFLIFAGAFGSDDARCDLNGDGRVGFEDFLIFVQLFGKRVPVEVTEIHPSVFEVADTVRVVVYNPGPALDASDVQVLFDGELGRVLAILGDTLLVVVPEAVSGHLTLEVEGERMGGLTYAILSQTLTVDVPGGATMVFVKIDAGTFTMGAPDSDEYATSIERPQFRVTITRGFYLGRHEVTQGQWESVVGTRPWEGQAHVLSHPNHPAVHVSWLDAQTFVQRLNAAVGDSLYRLPTEAEWEYACRAGSTARWTFGDDVSEVRDHAWYRANTVDVGMSFAQPVGKRFSNAWGLYDMHGNVGEWVQDRFGSYTTHDKVDPQGAPSISGPARLIRGGSFGNEAHELRSTIRIAGNPGTSGGGVGFRVLRMFEPASHRISGQVMDGDDGLAGAVVRLSGARADTVVTDAHGRYAFSRIADGHYSVRPSKEGYVFSPARAAVEVAGESVAALNFSGEIGVPGGGIEEIYVTLPGDVEMAFVYIEPGAFMMGSPDVEADASDWEKPRHEVAISRGFYLGKYEVTQAQWEAVVGINPSSYRGADRPVDGISWEDAQVFVQRLNAIAGHVLYRLPTEAEWEYACRAGSTTRWAFGDDVERLGDYAWYSDTNNPYGTKAVGSKLPNAWGLYDMHGNVWEWVQDRYSGDYYSTSPSADPQGPESGSWRVVRGGGFHTMARWTRSAYRSGNPPSTRDSSFGLRLLRVE